MATVFVNNTPVEIGTEKLNAIQAAKKAGVLIPSYCWHEALTVVASCRMCLIEIGERKPDGSIAMQPKVVPGCQTPVKDGTVVVTGEFEKSEAAEKPPQAMNYTRRLQARRTHPLRAVADARRYSAQSPSRLSGL